MSRSAYLDMQHSRIKCCSKLDDIPPPPGGGMSWMQSALRHAQPLPGPDPAAAGISPQFPVTYSHMA